MTGLRIYHHNATDTTELVVNEVQSNLVVLNGTMGITSAGSQYRLVLRYTNSTGHGLNASTVTIENVLPSAGFSNSSFTDMGNGYYSVILYPADVAIYNIGLRANLTNHVTSHAAFAIQATQVPTTLTLALSTHTIGIGELYTLNMTLVDENLQGVENAVISIIDAPAELTFYPPTNLTGGDYSILIEAQLF